MPNFIDRNYDSPLDLCVPLGAGARPAAARRRSARWLERVGRYFDDERLRRISASRRCTPASPRTRRSPLYAVITYMDTVDGRVRRPTAAMHAVPTGAGRRGRARPARRSATTTRVDADRARRRDGGAGPRRPARRRRARAGRRRRVQRRPAGRLPHAAARDCRAPRRRPPRPLLALRRGVARRRPRASCRRVRHTTTSTSAQPVGRRRSATLLDDGRRDARSVDAGHVPDARRSDAWPRPTGTRCTCSSRCPNLDGRVDWTAEREPRPRRARSSRSPQPGTRPTSRSRSSSTRSTGSARAWSGARRSRLVAPLPPDRPVPPGQRRAARARPGLRRVGDGARRRRADGARVRRAGRRAGSRRWARADEPVSRSRSQLRPCRALHKRYGTTYYWATCAAAARSSATTCGRCTRSAGTPTTSSTISDRRPHPSARRRRSPSCGERFFDDLDAGAPTTRCSKAVVAHGPRLRTSTPTCFERFLRSMTMDLTVDRYDTWDDLLDYMDGSAAVIGEMMLPILEPSIARGARPGTRPRARVPADQLPARRRRGSGARARVPAAGGSRAVRRRAALDVASTTPGAR